MQPRGVTVVATVKILHPGPDLYCPDVEFVWGEFVTSKIESDCEPLKDGEVAPDFYLARSQVYGPGEHRIVVNIKQGKKEIRLEGIAEVQGE